LSLSSRSSFQNLRTAQQFNAFPQTRDSLIFAQIQELFLSAAQASRWERRALIPYRQKVLTGREV
jgi:hypothetical protein